MGLFSSTKIPQPPLPEIAIHLYSPTDKVFRPGDLVSGHVSFTPVAPIAPRALEVSLFGQSLIWHRTSRSDGNHTTYYHWRDSAPLFEIGTNVLAPWDPEAPAMTVGQTYTFPFNFQFPAGTGNTRSGQYEDDSDELWTVGPHDLPPTFLSTNRNKYVDQPNYAKVEYGVRARLVCPGIGIVQGKNIADFTFTAPVLFAPLNPAPPYGTEEQLNLRRYTASHRLQTSALTGQSSSEIGFRQTLRDRFSSRTPNIAFEATVEMPELLMCGAEFRFRTSFKVVDKSDNASRIPPVHFTILKLDLKDTTFVRAPRDPDASTLMSGVHRKNKFRNMPLPDSPYSGAERKDTCRREVPLNALPASATVELGDLPGSADKKEMRQARTCGVWFTARVPSSTPPSFRCFAIARSYQVKITYGVEVAGKRFKQDVKGLIREVVAGPM